MKEIPLDLNKDGIYRAFKSKSHFYKDYYFIQYKHTDDIPEAIDVPIVCKIDEIEFVKQTDAARYLGVSRQSINQAMKLKQTKIKGKEIIWLK